jgi:hypothetical protein
VKKYLLVIARYEDERQEIFEKYISPKNKDYCLKHGAEYILIDNSWDVQVVRDNPTWWKFSIPQLLIEENYIKEGDSLTHFDADMVLVKPEREYTTEKSFSYAIDNGNTHCMGNYCMNLNEWSINLIKNILDEEFYQKNKDAQHWKDFREQAAWYSLAGIITHSWKSFLDTHYYGFHSLPMSQAKYSLVELLRNVEIKSPEWNTTLLSEECDNPVSQMLEQYNIARSKKEDTIIRHFAGGQPWRKEYLQ